MSKTQEIIDTNIENFSDIKTKYELHAESYEYFIINSYNEFYNMITYLGYITRILYLFHDGKVTISEDMFVETEQLFKDKKISIHQEVHDDGSFTIKLVLEDKDE